MFSVSCVLEHASGEGRGAGDGEDDDEEESRRKRVKRGASGDTAASLARRRSTRIKVSTRGPTLEEKDGEGHADAGNKRRSKGPIVMSSWPRLI